MPVAEKSKVTRKQLIDSLNDDLSREYQAINLISRPYAGARALMARPWSARCYGVARQREGSRQNSIGVVYLICLPYTRARV
jgi:hypothetical protein